jgi:hypothetical protein
LIFRRETKPFVIIDDDVSIGAELQNLVLLGCLTRDTDKLIGAESLGEEDAKVNETTDTDDADLLSVRLCL